MKQKFSFTIKKLVAYIFLDGVKYGDIPPDYLLSFSTALRTLIHSHFYFNSKFSQDRTKQTASSQSK